MAIASLVLGIIAAVIAAATMPLYWYVFAFCLILTIVGLVLGIKAKNKATEEKSPTGLAIASIVVNVVIGCFCIYTIIRVFVILSELQAIADSL